MLNRHFCQKTRIEALSKDLECPANSETSDEDVWERSYEQFATSLAASDGTKPHLANDTLFPVFSETPSCQFVNKKKKKKHVIEVLFRHIFDLSKIEFSAI